MMTNPTINRREFLQRTALATGTCLAGNVLAQVPGARPPPSPGVTVLNPRHRVPVGLIIDDSTCLVNLNRFAVLRTLSRTGAPPAAVAGWPVEIPCIRSIRRWCAGMEGQIQHRAVSACVGRLDRIAGLDGAKQASIDLVRTLMLPNWTCIEMVSHTRVIMRTGHPHRSSRAFRELALEQGPQRG